MRPEAKRFASPSPESEILRQNIYERRNFMLYLFLSPARARALARAGRREMGFF